VVAAVFVVGAAVFVAGAAVFVGGAAVDAVVGAPAAKAGADDAIATRGKRRIAVPVRTAFSMSERFLMKYPSSTAAHMAVALSL
jgi:hypothetical protein